MSSIQQWFKLALILWMFVLGIVVVTFLIPVFHWFSERRSLILRDFVVLHWNRAVLRILDLKVTFKGEPDPNAGFIVANHISWLDIIALGSISPRTFVAKVEVAGWPVLGYLAQRIGTLFIHRGDENQTKLVAEQMLWRLKRGERLMLFPEGTTTTGERVLRFHGKLFRPAALADARVQAVALRYQGESRSVAPFVGDDDFLPHLLSVIRLKTVDLEISYCSALPSGLKSSAMADITRRQISDALSGGSGATVGDLDTGTVVSH